MYNGDLSRTVLNREPQKQHYRYELTQRRSAPMITQRRSGILEQMWPKVGKQLIDKRVTSDDQKHRGIERERERAREREREI